jgi:tripartite-type tricarboxylate transporter receptor subunit TctC
MAVEFRRASLPLWRVAPDAPGGDASMKTKIAALVAALPIAALLVAGPAAAQTYPAKPIRVIVPFTPGSGTDIVARAVGEKLSVALGQPVVVENRPGAGGTIGANLVAKADPDGYTLLVHSSGHTVNPAIYTNLPYDTAKDFVGVTPLASLPNVLIVAPGAAFKSVQELVAVAKAKPGQLNYASAGTGSATHMNAEKFRVRAGFEATHVPYKGTPEAITDTMTGRIDFFFAPLVSARPMIADGKVLALAVGARDRSPLLPDVPTTVEAGVADSDYNFWVGMFAPAKTPRAIVARLNEETLKALRTPELVERLRTLGATPMPMAPDEFDAYVADEIRSVAEIVRTAGIQAN